MDGSMIQLVEDAFHLGFPKVAKALLLTEIDGIADLLDGQAQQLIDISNRHNAKSVQSSADPDVRAKLWKARKTPSGAIGRVSHSYCTQDACVPRSMLAGVLQRIDEIGKSYGLQISNVFHAGDGNVHPIFMYDDRDPTQVKTTLEACEEVLKYCIDIGGTLTGEHGVGVEKIHLMSYLFDGNTMRPIRPHQTCLRPRRAHQRRQVDPEREDEDQHHVAGENGAAVAREMTVPHSGQRSRDARRS